MIEVSEKIIIVGSLIALKNKILMVQENEPRYYGMWSLPTGHYQYPETIEEGIKRETKEETGLDIKISGYLPIYITNTKKIIRATSIITGGTIHPDGIEIKDIKYMSLEEIFKLPENKLRGYKIARRFLEDYIQGKIYKKEEIPEIIIDEPTKPNQKVYTP